MKTSTNILLSLLLIVSAAAVAQNHPPTRTYEMLGSTVRLPSSETGTITVKACRSCEYETYRVTERTIYSINKQAMRLEDFRLAVENLRLTGDPSVNVRLDLETRTIGKVFIHTR